MDLIVKADNSLAPREMHRRLGSRFKDSVKSFIETFPLNSNGKAAHYPVKDFDLWLEREGCLLLPQMQRHDDPNSQDPWRPVAGTKSDAWVAHTQRRYRQVQEFNKASAHTRVRDEGIEPFVIRVSHGMLTVRRTEQKVSLGDLPREVESILRTKRQKLDRLFNSSDFTVLPLSEQITVQSLMHSIQGYETTIFSLSQNLRGHFELFRASLKRSVEGGQVVPNNGAINALIYDKEDGAI